MAFHLLNHSFSNQSIRALLIALLLVTTSAITSASSHWEGLFFDQLDEASTLKHQRFSFHQRSLNNEDVEILVYQPDNQPQWLLVEVNGAPPSKKELKKFDKRMAKLAEEPDRSGFHDLITKGSVTVVKTEADKIWLSFIPKIGDLPEENQSSLEGFAVMDRANETLLELHIDSKEQFSPAFSVKISTMNIAVYFEKAHGVTLPTVYEFSMNGKIAGVKKLDINSNISYSNYQPIMDNK